MLGEETKKAVADYVLDQNYPDRLNLLVNMQDAWESIRAFSDQVDTYPWSVR